MSSSWLLAARPMSSAFCAHCSACISLSRFSRMKLENADSDLLSPCASLLYANVLLAKLKARKSIDLWSAICRTWYAWEQSSLQNMISPARCCAASDSVLTGWLLLS